MKKSDYQTVKNLVVQLEQILSDAPTAGGRAGRRTVSERFVEELMVETTDTILNRLGGSDIDRVLDYYQCKVTEDNLVYVSSFVVNHDYVGDIINDCLSQAFETLTDKLGVEMVDDVG